MYSCTGSIFRNVRKISPLGGSRTSRTCRTITLSISFCRANLRLSTLFRTFRDVILGYKHTNTLTNAVSPTPPEERVGSIQASSEREDCSIIDSMNNSTTKKEKKMKVCVGKNLSAVTLCRSGKRCGCERPCWQQEQIGEESSFSRNNPVD